MERETFFFPLRNEQGFKVDCPENYVHMISTIINTTTELEEDYPDKRVLVVYEVENVGN